MTDDAYRDDDEKEEKNKEKKDEKKSVAFKVGSSSKGKSKQDTSVGGMTLDTHDRLHGLRSQGWSSPQDEDLRCTVLLNVYRKTSMAISLRCYEIC